MSHQFFAKDIMVAPRESVGMGTFLPRSGSCASTSNIAEIPQPHLSSPLTCASPNPQVPFGL